MTASRNKANQMLADRGRFPSGGSVPYDVARELIATALEQEARTPAINWSRDRLTTLADRLLKGAQPDPEDGPDANPSKCLASTDLDGQDTLDLARLLHSLADGLPLNDPEAWQPIANAPTDGRWYIVGCWVTHENGTVEWSSWAEPLDGSTIGCDGRYGDPATHFREMPAPPPEETCPAPAGIAA